jgi:hypothetical protein
MSLLGAGLPTDLIGPLPNDNETGFWESVALNEAHEAILASARSSWDDVSPFDPAWLRSSTADEFVEHVARVVGAKFGDAPLIVVKDPRVCRFVPFWLRVLERLTIRPAFVLPIRNPLEVAASLQARNRFPVAKSLLLWLRHLLDAERDTRGHPRSFVTYQLLLSDWRAVVRKVEADLKLSWPSSHLASAEISSFLSPHLRHHRIDVQELRESPDVSEWVVKAYDAALDLATGSDSSSLRTLDDLREQLHAAHRTFGPMLADLREQLHGFSELMSGLAHERDPGSATTLPPNLSPGQAQDKAEHAARLASVRAARAVEEPDSAPLSDPQVEGERLAVRHQADRPHQPCETGGPPAEPR